jgi:hypothetical protein
MVNENVLLRDASAIKLRINGKIISGKGLDTFFS